MYAVCLSKTKYFRLNIVRGAFSLTVLEYLNGYVYCTRNIWHWYTYVRSNTLACCNCSYSYSQTARILVRYQFCQCLIQMLVVWLSINSILWDIIIIQCISHNYEIIICTKTCSYNIYNAFFTISKIHTLWS